MEGLNNLSRKYQYMNQSLFTIKGQLPSYAPNLLDIRSLSSKINNGWNVGLLAKVLSLNSQRSAPSGGYISCGPSHKVSNFS